MTRNDIETNWTIESHSNLGDYSLEQYKNRNATKISIDAISNAMGIFAQEDNDKIHRVRCQFQSINRKQKKQRAVMLQGIILLSNGSFIRL